MCLSHGKRGESAPRQGVNVPLSSLPSLQPVFPKSVKNLSNRQRRNSKTAPAKSCSLPVQSKYNTTPEDHRAEASSLSGNVSGRERHFSLNLRQVSLLTVLEAELTSGEVISSEQNIINISMPLYMLHTGTYCFRYLTECSSQVNQPWISCCVKRATMIMYPKKTSLFQSE